MASAKSLIPLLMATWASASTSNNTKAVDTSWHPPKKSWVNDLDQVMNSTGTHGFVFSGSQLPAGVPYGTYNWCNMPHVRREEYKKAGDGFELIYVEVIHRHHKRTPYAANTFPKESYSWNCNDQGLFYYGSPLNPTGNISAPTYWSVYTSPSNPFTPPGFPGSCQFPQITREGLDDSFQHGKDLYGVYHDLLHFLPSHLSPSQITYRVTNNVITSQVASMLIQGMWNTSTPQKQTPLHIQPPTVDSLEPQYPCPAASSLYASYATGSTHPAWTPHLHAAKPLFTALDAISGIPANATPWHTSLDHYYDNLSARQCHAKPLPCRPSPSNKPTCITQAQADAVYRLGQYEYSFTHRDAPLSLPAAKASFGVWLAELAAHMRAAVAADSRPAINTTILYRHNVAHDGSVARLLSLLQVEQMVWVGMGAEVVFEVYRRRRSRSRKETTSYALRVLWGGRVLRSSSGALGVVDMLPLEVFLGYVDGLVGVGAGDVVGFCEGEGVGG